jgi:type IV pilus assembly protein PilB
MPTLSPEISVKISNFLKGMGKVNDQNIADAQKAFESNGKAPLGVIQYLLKSNQVTEDDVVSAISRNYALRKINLTEQNIKADAVNKLPRDFISLHEMIPFEIEGRVLKIAIFDPSKSSLAGKIKSMTGLNIEMYVAKPSNLDSAFKFKSFLNPSEAGTVAEGNSQQSVTPTAAQTALKQSAQFKAQPIILAKKEDESQVVVFVDQVLKDAFTAGASDIHIEPYRHGEARI